MSLNGMAYGAGAAGMSGLAKGAGVIGALGTMGAVHLLPGQVSSAVLAGLSQANIAGFLGQQFAMAPFANLRLGIYNAIEGIGEHVSKEWNKIDQAAFKYAKSVGLAKEQAEKLRNEMIQFANDEHLAAKFGKSANEIIEMQMKLSHALQRNVRLTHEQTKSLAALSTVVGDDTAMKFVTSLDKFGISATQAGDMMAKMWGKAVKQGLSLEAYAKNVNDNLHLAQQYGFKKGIDGLMSMAEKATKIKMDMSEIARLADNLSDIDKVVNASASLQVLGGPFAQFANPFGLLHDSLMDLDGLQDRVAELTDKMVHFNRKTGKAEFGSDFDRLRLREFAKVTGMDFGKLTDTAFTQAKRKEVDKQLVGLSNIPEEYKELIRNSATFENGVAGIPGADGKFKALSKLDTNDLKNLVNSNKTEAENIADIAEMLRGAIDVSEGREKAKGDAAAQEYAEQAEARKGMVASMAENTAALKELVRLETSKKTMDAVTGIWSGLANTVLAGVSIVSMLRGGRPNAIRGIPLRHDKGGSFGVTHGGKPGVEHAISTVTKGDKTFVNGISNNEYVSTEAVTRRHAHVLDAANRANGDGEMYFIPHNAGGGMANDASTETNGWGYAAGGLTLASLALPRTTNTTNIFSNLRTLPSGNQIGVLSNGTVVAFDRATGIARQFTRAEAEAFNLTRNGQFNASNFFKNGGNAGRGFTNRAMGTGRELGRFGNISNYGSGRIAARVVGGHLLSGALSGVYGGMDAWDSYKESGEDIMNREKAVKGTTGAAIGGAVAGIGGSILGGMAAGALAGTWAGPIGWIVGGLIGAVVGGIGAWVGKSIGESLTSTEKDRSEARLKYEKGIGSKLGIAKFRHLIGDYSPDEYENITKALNDGALYENELSKELVQKIKAHPRNEQLFTKDEQNAQKFERGGKVIGAPHNKGGVWVNAEGGEEFIDKKNSEFSDTVINDVREGKLQNSQYEIMKSNNKAYEQSQIYKPNNEGGVRNGGIGKVEFGEMTMHIDIKGNGSLSKEAEKELLKQFTSPNIERFMRDNTQLMINEALNGGALNKHEVGQRSYVRNI